MVEKIKDNEIKKIKFEKKTKALKKVGKLNIKK